MDTAEDFKTLVEKLVHLILAHHKHAQLPDTLEDPIPGFLTETEAYLIRKIKPFLPSEETNLCFHFNAKNWTLATIETFKEHYDRIHDKTVDTIRALLVPDWSRAVLVASRRAKQLSVTIKPTTFEHMHTLLKNITTPSFPENPYNKPISGKETSKIEPKETPQNPNTSLSLKNRMEDIIVDTLDWDNFSTYGDSELEDVVENPSQIDGPRQSYSSGPNIEGEQLLNNPDNNTRLCLTPSETILDHTTTLSPTRKREEETEGPIQNKRQKLDYPTQKRTPLLNNPLDLPQTHKKTTTQTSGTTCHPYLGNKFLNWNLKPIGPIIIMGDSNILRLPPIGYNGIQIDSYPGAKIMHAEHIIKHKTEKNIKNQNDPIFWD